MTVAKISGKEIELMNAKEGVEPEDSGIYKLYNFDVNIYKKTKIVVIDERV